MFCSLKLYVVIMIWFYMIHVRKLVNTRINIFRIKNKNKSKQVPQGPQLSSLKSLKIRNPHPADNGHFHSCNQRTSKYDHKKWRCDLKCKHPLSEWASLWPRVLFRLHDDLDLFFIISQSPWQSHLLKVSFSALS